MPSFQSKRYRQLVEELGAKSEYAYGWKAKTARRLGVHPSYINKVLKGDIGDVGGEVINRACKSLQLDPSFFLDDSADALSRPHADYVRPRIAVGPASPGPRGTGLGLGLKNPDLSPWLDLTGLILALHESATFRFEGDVRLRVDPAVARGLARGVMALPVVEAARSVLEDDLSEDELARAALELAEDIRALQRLVLAASRKAKASDS